MLQASNSINCTEYDNTDEFNCIKDSVEEIRQFCVIHRIPMFFAFAIKNNEQETVYERECVGSGSNGIILANDIFPKLIGVSAGLDVKLPLNESVEAIEMEKLTGQKEISEAVTAKSKGSKNK